MKGNPHEGFYSRIFLAPKKGGKWRPVINLKPLNQFIKKQKFKMATLQSTIQDVNAGDWLVSIDLKDAYFHVPIHLSHWKYLRFAVGNDKYEFMVIPFGITTAPRVFTKMMAPAAEYIRKEMGLYNSPYLDDFLMKDKERSFLVSKSQEVINFMLDIGLVINWEKSEIVPSQDWVHVGARFRTSVGMGTLPEERVLKVVNLVETIQRAHQVSARDFLRMLGLLNSCIYQVDSARLFLRPIQLYLKAMWKPSTGDLKDMIPIRPGLVEHLNWWKSAENLQSGLPLKQPDPQHTLVTDASMMGWGGVPGGWRRNQGDMVRGGVPETHKLAGDEGSLQQPDLFQESVVQENHDSDQVRQQNGGGISQQTGRNEVDLVVLSDVGGTKLVQGMADSSESSLHQGSGKCSGRSSFQEGRSSRVVPLSGGGSESVPDLGEASGGSVRKRVEQQAGHILLEGERSGGVQDRRIESGLERPGNVCVSPRTSDPKSDSKSEIQHNKNDTSGFEQKSETVDVSARRATVGHSKSSTSKGKVTKDAKLKRVPSGSRKPAFSCLDDRRRKLRQKGFRRGAAEMATGDIRKSTASCYSARVQAYVRWCNENGVKNPVGSSVASVCNFLYGLYEKGKAARTIGGYISAISKWHDRVHGKSLCEVPQVASFRKASLINRPLSQVNFNS